jgi:D-arabinose 1-dehydrogenase-like Zn-dependent alcohol dehydrogenase
MKAALLLAHGMPLVIEQIPLPPPPKGSEVVLRVDGCGICGSDVHLARGNFPYFPPSFPHIMGHEIGGYVYEVGDQVKGLAVGDPVVVWAGGGCGTCSFCISGRELNCTKEHRWAGSNIPGGYAEYVLIEHERWIVKLKPGMRPRDAAPFTDAAITGYGSVRKAIRHFDPEFPVLALGIGAIGTYGLQYLKTMSGCRIIAVDVTPEKRAAALEWGADHALNGESDMLVDEIMALSDGEGVCAALDFVGTQKTIDTALAVTRADGGIFQTGMAGGIAHVDGTNDPRHWSVDVQFSLGATLKQLREVMAMVQAGRIKPIPIDFRPLEEINEVHADMHANRTRGRIVVIP